MDKLGNVLPRVLRKQPGAARVTEMRVRLAFIEVLGQELAAVCDTVELKGSTLSVTTSNPALAHQLRLDAERLLERLNEHPQGRRLKALRVQTGRSHGGGRPS